LADRERFPTTFSVAPSGRSGYGPLVTAYLQRFSWKLVTILCDNSSKFLATSPVNSDTCLHITKSLSRDFDAYEEQVIFFDSEASETFTPLLLSIRSHGKSQFDGFLGEDKFSSAFTTLLTAESK
jgi:hypothetical protein